MDDLELLIGKLGHNALTRVINPEDYTPEIEKVILKIKDRMRMTLVDFTEQDIVVFEHESMIYVLANPLLGEEPVFDEMGNFQEIISMYNLTVIYDKDWIKTELSDDKVIFTAKIPKLRILRPDLCVRID